MDQLMLAYELDPDDPTPLYAQLERAIRASIASGLLSVGERLPTVRELAVELRVNANTVAKVYSELERAGVVETRRGVGTFVRRTTPDRRPPRERELRALADRFLADAGALGFSFDQVITHLESRRSSGRD